MIEFIETTMAIVLVAWLIIIVAVLITVKLGWFK